jgi:hypothetical protein
VLQQMLRLRKLAAGGDVTRHSAFAGPGSIVCAAAGPATTSANPWERLR